MPEAVHKIYTALEKSIPTNKIHVLDNGSDSNLIYSNTSIRIPVNKKVSGAYRHIFNKAIEEDVKFIVTITTSAILLDLNYLKGIHKTIKSRSNSKWSAIYGNINNIDSDMKESISDQIQVKDWVINPFHAQPLLTIWNVEYLKEIKQLKHGWFDEHYVNGQGATEDMRMYNLTSGWNEWTTQYITIDWWRNSTHRYGRAGVEAKEYYKNNKREYNQRFKSKFNMTKAQVESHLLRNSRKEE